MSRRAAALTSVCTDTALCAASLQRAPARPPTAAGAWHSGWYCGAGGARRRIVHRWTRRQHRLRRGAAAALLQQRHPNAPAMPPKPAAKAAAAAAAASTKAAAPAPAAAPAAAAAATADAAAAGGAADAPVVDAPAPEVDERKAKIKAAFAIFDPENTGTIPEEEVPTVLRYLDVFVPDKDYVDKVLVDLHGDEPKPFIRYEKFEEVCIRVMDAHEYDPDGPEVLLAAFRALDPDGKGFIEVDKMKAVMSEVGEPPFRDKELEAFIKIAVDKETGKIFYEDYVALMSRA